MNGYLAAMHVGAPRSDAQAPAARPEIWLAPPNAPDGRSWRQLFELPEQWAETRARVQVLAYADHNLDRQFSDDELRA